MKYRKLGRTKLNVSEIGFGVWSVTTGWWGIVGRDQALKILNKAYDLGINFYDTADMYGRGLGEEILAEAFGKDLDRLIIATKFGYDFYSKRDDSSRTPQDFSPEYVRFALEQSLKRLKRGWIDLYQLHNPPLKVIQEGAVFNVLEELKEEGKIRYYGVALGPETDVEAEGIASLRRDGVSSIQLVYNMLEQQPARKIIDMASSKGVGVITRVPHATGALMDDFDPSRSYSSRDHRSLREKDWFVKVKDVVKRIRSAIKSEATLAQLAISFCLHKSGVSSVLPTITSEMELEEFVKAIDKPLDEEEVKIIENIYDKELYG